MESEVFKLGLMSSNKFSIFFGSKMKQREKELGFMGRGGLMAE
jgi:hypothetical protein